MMKYLEAVACIFVVICLTKGNSTSPGEDGGTYLSPGFSENYPNNMEYYHTIKARIGFIIYLQFLTFETEGLDEAGNMTDYLRIFDGRKTDNPTPLYLYGNLTTPFVIISKTNRLRMKMASNHNVTYRGVRAVYRFFNKSGSCDTSLIESNRGRTLIGCNRLDRSNSGTSRCNLRCKDNYKLSGRSISYCLSNGVFTPVHCNVIGNIIRLCEDTNLTDCPYTFEEIEEYYQNHQLEVDRELSREEAAEEHRALIDLELLGQSGRFTPGCRSYCKRKGRYYAVPRRCGRIYNSSQRISCFKCRFTNGCVGTEVWGR